MAESQVRLQTIDEVCQFVSDTLSRYETLQPDRLQLTLHLLNRSGKPCGIFFRLHGPRAVRLTAIWETDSNTILFYGSRGERIERIKLAAAPLIRNCLSAGAKTAP
jgi:hypothetical protein